MSFENYTEVICTSIINLEDIMKQRSCRVVTNPATSSTHILTATFLFNLPAALRFTWNKP